MQKLNGTAVVRARAYLGKLPVAIAGSGGHATTFRAACALVEFGLPEAEAWPLLLEWNAECQPPWAEGDLRHKLADAFKRTQPRVEFGGRSQRRPSSPLVAWRDPGCRDGSRATQRRPVTPAPTPAVTRTAAPAPGASQPPKEGAGLVLPPSTEGTPEEHAVLASLRGVSLEAVALAVQRGLLRFGEQWKRPAWFILDSERIATARRMDGKDWWQDTKAPFLRGSQARWPVGVLEAADCPFVALVEGGPDLLAVCHLIASKGRAADVAPVAMLSAAPLIHPDAMPLFRGKRVRIFPHADDAGFTACERWAGQLVHAGAEVDAFSLAGLQDTAGESIKDLNELVRAMTADSALRERLPSLFSR